VTACSLSSDSPLSATTARKAALRRHLLAARRALDPDTAARAALAARDHALTLPAPPSGAVVAGFWPLAGEIDPRPLLEALRARGHPLALPVTPPPGAAPSLVFRVWDGDPDALEPGPFHTRQPAATAPAVEPDWILVPVVGFDRRGHRLGFGAGYYDRFLDGRAATAVGLAFACQEVPLAEGGVPVEPHDVPLTAVVTERGLIRPDDTARRKG
jgi:5-formyltetrahydrofolate cyclo-ligase